MNTKSYIVTGALIVAILLVIVVSVMNRPKSVNEKLKDLKLNVPQKSIEAVTEGFREGVQIAQNEYDRKQKIVDETKTMKDMLLDALSD